MPEKEGNILKVKVKCGAFEQEGILFEPADCGAAWKYSG